MGDMYYFKKYYAFNNISSVLILFIHLFFFLNFVNCESENKLIIIVGGLLSYIRQKKAKDSLNVYVYKVRNFVKSKA